MKIFANGELRVYLDEQKKNLITEVENEDVDKLLNVIEDEYLAYLENKYYIEPLKFEWETISYSDKEKLIPGALFSPLFGVDRSKSYSKQVFNFYLSFLGNSELLKYTPSTYISWTQD